MENWIKTNREALGLSQAKLAVALGVGKSSVNAWEQEERRPSVKAWTRLAAFFKEHGLEVPPMPDNLPQERKSRRKAGTDPGKLREKREASGLSVGALAAALGVNRHSVTAWERGTSAPSREALDALCELFDCNPEELGFPRIRNGLTVEERNDLLMGYLLDIRKACYGMRRLMYATGTDQEDARQDAALAVLEAINRAEDPHDPEALRHYIFRTIKFALLSSARRSKDKGFSVVPYKVYPVLVSLDALCNGNMGPTDADEWGQDEWD